MGFNGNVLYVCVFAGLGGGGCEEFRGVEWECVVGRRVYIGAGLCLVRHTSARH